MGLWDKQLEQGSRWEAQAKEHGYNSVGWKEDISEAENRQV